MFWKSLSRIGVSSSLNFWENSAVKLSGLGLLFAGRFLITVSISVLVMGLLRFSISSCPLSHFILRSLTMRCLNPACGFSGLYRSIFCFVLYSLSGTPIIHFIRLIPQLWMLFSVFFFFFSKCFSLDSFYWPDSLILSLVVSSLLPRQLKEFFVSFMFFP